MQSGHLEIEDGVGLAVPLGTRRRKKTQGKTGESVRKCKKK